MADENVPCYIARCKCGCGSLVFASVDEPNQSAARRKDNAKEIASMIADGFTIERMNVGEVRTAKWGCATKAATS
jgi:hypothetical protein